MYYLILLLLTACSAPQVEEQKPDVLVTKYIHPYGVTVPQHQWEEAGENGQILVTTRDGVTRMESYYCGALEGDTSYTYPFSDSIQKVESYSQDVLKKEMTFHANGQKQTEVIHDDIEPKQLREWYENGNLKSFEKHAGSLLSYGEYYDIQGNRTSQIENGSGVKAMHDTYGLLWSLESHKEGEKETQTTYHPNGSPKEITPYKNGLVEGMRKTYYPGGEPKTHETWVAGMQEGITTLFCNAEKSEEVPYKNGRKNGIGRLYKDGAIVVQEMTWREDQMHGPCRTYIEDRVATEWYFKGNKVTKGYWDSFHFQPTPEETPHSSSLQAAP